ncbi:MAG: ATP-binding protein [Myxococcota bacterium]
MTTARPIRRFRLGTIVLAVALASAVPLLLFGAWVLWSLGDAQRSVIDRQNIEMARAVSVSIDKEIDSTIGALRVLASIDAVSDEPTDEELHHYEDIALRLVARQPRWRSVLLLAPDGHVVSSTASDLGAESFGGSPWFQRIVATLRSGTSELLQDPATGRHFVVVGVPVRQDGRLHAVVAAEISSEALSDVLRRQSPFGGGVVTLLDGTLTIMARTRGESRYVGGPPSQPFLDAAQRMTEGAWDSVLLEGTPAYAALSRSELTGWTVGIGVGADAVDEPIRRAALALAALAVISGFGVALSVLVGRQVATDLGGVAAAARGLSTGTAVGEGPGSRVAEVEELMGSVRAASAALEERRRERDAAEAAHEAVLRREQAAREAVQRNEVRLRVTVASIGDAVVATDAEARITLINPVAQALTGWSEGAAVGRRIDEVVVLRDERSGELVRLPVAEILAGDASQGVPRDAHLVGRSGREVPVEDSVAPIRAGDGEVQGLVLVFRDVTEAREAELARVSLLEQEQHARRQAELAAREKDEFVATVSHELRNPLNAIVGWVKLLRSGALDAANTEHGLDVLDRNARTQARLIEDLLDMSRVARGKLHLDLRPVEVGPIVEAAVLAVAPTARAKELELACEIGGIGGALGDADRLQQVFWNLLTNAIKFTPRGGRITVTGVDQGDEVVITVTDDGIGVDAALLPHIFDRFTQGVAATGAKAGLGIGLSLVRHLVELHGGTVSARSAGSGAGATFEVRLPRLDHVVATEGLPREDSDTASSPALEGLRALVVEDDPDSRDLVVTTLRGAGATVTPAASGRDALDVIGTCDPDVVFSDVGMPGMTGYELVAKLRSDPRWQELVVVAVTAYGRSQDREHAFAVGFDQHLAKPVDPIALVRIAASVRRRLRRS